MSDKYRYPDQIDMPNDSRVWPTYWARSPHVAPDSPQMVHSWNADSPLTGFIDNITTKERAILIVTAVNSHDALVAALILARETLYKMPALGERQLTLRGTTNEQINAVLKLAEGECQP